MSDISLSLASLLYNVGNFALAVGSLLALAGTIVVVWTGGVKERYADERIAAGEAETAKANAIASEARLEVVQAEERIAKLNLQIARMTAQRGLSNVDLERLQENCSPYKEISFDTAANSGDPEALRFADSLADALAKIGWTQADFMGAIFTDRPGRKRVGLVNGQGVLIVYYRSHYDKLSKPAEALMNALKASDIVTSIEIYEDGVSGLDVGTLHLAIGKQVY